MTIQISDAVPTGIATMIVTGWIMIHFESRAEKIVLGQHQIAIERDSVRRIVFEALTRERSQ